MYWEGEDEAGTVGVGGVEVEGAAQMACKGAAEGEAKSDTFFEGVELDEALEDVFGLGGGDTTACVLNGDTELVGFTLGIDGDFALLRIFDGVFKQGCDDALEHVDIGLELEIVGNRRLIA